MKKDYIQIAIQFAKLVKSTLGPKGMNKMVVSDADSKHLVILTNDGATILNNVKSDNPITQLFKNLAISQEEAVGDGTTSAVILAGELLENALDLLKKGVHQTTIINGYSIAMMECLNYLNKVKYKGDKLQIIKTAFGSKIPKELANLLANLLINEDVENLYFFQIPNSNPLETEIIKGFAFEGHTINDRLSREEEGNIAVLEIKSQMDFSKIQVNKAEEWEKAEKVDREYKKKIVNKLKELNVKIVFLSDTNPELESFLTEAKIMTIPVWKRPNLDGICRATGAIASSSPDNIKIGWGRVVYEKPEKIFIYNDKSEIKTLILRGSTVQTLDETERAIHDVIGLLKLSNDCVVGAGSIEIRLSQHLREFARQIGGKEQIAIQKFADSLEIIPLTIAENAGLDAVEVLTHLKKLHSEGKVDYGVDIVKKVSNAKEKGIIEPVWVKVHMISSATQVANLILKLDEVLIGEDEKKD